MPHPPPSGHVPVLPPGFVLGTATSAFQVEGAAERGPVTWDLFTHHGGTHDGATGDVAVDHYGRLAEDLDLVRRLGAGGYRFSISWARVQPDGRGALDPRGLDFYDRMLDGLLEIGVRPMATLYHWDLPQALQDDGGWLNRATIEHFADYAGAMGERFADRVADWVPVNGPNVDALLGHAVGGHAPGLALGFDGLHAAHHLLLAHGRGVVALRAAGATSVGCANNHAPMWPASDDAADVGATKIFDALWNGMYLEPMLLGRYPVDLAPLMDGLVEDGDLAVIRQPLDFYGVSYYRPMKVGAAGEDAAMPFELLETLGHPVTDGGWPVVPDALREWLITFRARFRAALPPIVITECGAAYNTGPDAHGVVDDQARIDFLAGHLTAVAEAVQRGVDVRGFYVWSLLDNLAWTEGLGQRFGLVHVDFETLQRTPKRSFEWFAAAVAGQPHGIG